MLDKIDDWDCGLEDAALNNLKSFFTTLGTTNIQGQLSYARLAAVQQQKMIDSVEKLYSQRSHICRTFGVLGGAFAAIMLI